MNEQERRDHAVFEARMAACRPQPDPEFSTSLRRRLFQMAADGRVAGRRNVPRRLAAALAISASLAVFALVLLLTPPGRAFAEDILRRIGVVVVTREEPSPPPPTALPPTSEPLHAGDAAEASALAGFAVYAPGYVPAGYAGEGDLVIWAQGDGVGIFAGYRETGTYHFLGLSQYSPGADETFWHEISDEQVEDVVVRGHAGVWIQGVRMEDMSGVRQPGQPELLLTNWLMWEEDGFNFTLYSDALPLDEMLNVAESLTGVSQ